MDQKEFYIHRSGLVSYQQCQRLAFWEYWYEGRGIVPNKAHRDSALGIARHIGVSELLLGADIEDAVKSALEEYEREASAGYQNIPDAILKDMKIEHRALVEAGLRFWAAVRLPYYLERYEVIEAEVERLAKLDPSLPITFLARVDAELKSRFDGQVYAFSLKNPKQFTKWKFDHAKIDMQGRSETWSLTNGAGQEPSTCPTCDGIGIVAPDSASITCSGCGGFGSVDRHVPPHGEANVGGVLMEYLATGVEKDDDWADNGDPESTVKPRIRWSPLIRGWTTLDETEGQIYAWKWRWDNPNYDAMKPAHKYQNPKTVSLGKKWTRAVAWEHPGGVKGWVEELLNHQMRPVHLDPAEDIIGMPPPYYRSMADIESFRRQAISMSNEIIAKLEALRSGAAALDDTFTQNDQHCLKYGESYRCPMYDVCWGDLKGKNLLEHGFKWRDPHHRTEVVDDK